MIKIDKKNCTCCSACKSICPSGAILLIENERGFKYPQVNANLCVKCGLCNKVCSCYQNQINSKQRLDEYRLYIANHIDKETQKKSQSGGVSFALGCEIINHGGTVYGCIYEENCKAIHSRCSSIDELKKTRGSKYVQSDLKNVFNEVLADLKDNKEVLFTGTSCQIEGLYLFLEAQNCNTKNLYTADIICHGVPSPKALDDFKLNIEKNNNQKVEQINLRNRKFHPKQINTSYLSNGVEINDNYYLEIFYSNIALRESCGYCKYAKFDKPADITMGDIIGIDNKYSQLIDKAYPPSIVIVHSEKGHKLLEKSKLQLTAIKNDEFYQPNLNYPSKINYQKDNFWKDYGKHGFEFVLKKYTSAGGIRTKIKRRILKKIGLW